MESYGKSIVHKGSVHQHHGSKDSKIPMHYLYEQVGSNQITDDYKNNGRPKSVCNVKGPFTMILCMTAILNVNIKFFCTFQILSDLDKR